MDKILKAINNPAKIVVFLDLHSKLHLPDKIFLKLLYKATLGKKLDIHDPKTYNEKLQWLKLNDRKKNLHKNGG